MFSLVFQFSMDYFHVNLNSFIIRLPVEYIIARNGKLPSLPPKHLPKTTHYGRTVPPDTPCLRSDKKYLILLTTNKDEQNNSVL